VYPYDDLTATGALENRAMSEPSLTNHQLAQRDLTELQHFIHSENYVRFQCRRSDIERQIKFLFVYPAAYVLLWIFPIIQLFIAYGEPQNPSSALLAVTYISDFMRQSNGSVNALVFYWKESQSDQLLDRSEECSSSEDSTRDRVRIESDRDLTTEMNQHTESRTWTSPMPEFKSLDREKLIETRPHLQPTNGKNATPIFREDANQPDNRPKDSQIPRNEEPDITEEIDLFEFLRL
jgi:hypothetical protein